MRWNSIVVTIRCSISLSLRILLYFLIMKIITSTVETKQDA